MVEQDYSTIIRHSRRGEFYSNTLEFLRGALLRRHSVSMLLLRVPISGIPDKSRSDPLDRLIEHPKFSDQQ